MDVSQQTVLVVEDSPLFRKLVGEFLHALGITRVQEASNGRSALEMLAHSRPDLVCLDLTLPDVSGYDVCEYIRGGGDRETFLTRFSDAASRGFDPDVDLNRIGLANQTTMLMSESLEIGEMVGAAIRDRYGADEAARHFRAFDTICSATQERQDAIVALLNESSWT